MRRNALTALAAALVGGMATAQPAATLGTPVSAATLGTPIASSTIVRASADDTPVLGVPEPGYPNTQVAYPPAFGAGGQNPQIIYVPVPVAPGAYAPASPYPPYQFTSSSLPYPGTEVTSTKGDPVRRTSFSSRTSTHTSKFGDGASGCLSDCCDWFKGCFSGEGGKRFESDHTLDVFTSPITNPFLAEDPRSLTEVRPIFFYQKIPGGNPAFNGGEAYFYGLQARLAFNERWSVVLNKLGGVTIDSGDGAIQSGGSGLAEIWIGPKWTFLRNCDTGSVLATGLTFQIPAGPSSVFQDTGSLSLVPYLTGAQNFGRSSYGVFNFMDTLGYSFSTGNGRSNYFYNSAHLDYDIASAHKYYAVLELNWFHYASSGDSRLIDQEGADLANIGGTNIGGRDYLTIAPGFRYKYSECVQFGIATEFPVISPKDLNDFRLTVDMIFRY